MIIQLGVVSGKIWKYLEENKQAPLAELVSKVNGERDKVLMSLGWMAREGHVVLEQKIDDYVVSLRDV